MAEWEKRIFAINLLVADLERSKTFYRDAFGMLPLDEEEDSVLFRFGDTFVMLRHDPAYRPPTDEALGLALQGVGQFAIVVEDVAAVGAELEDRGVTLISGPADRPWGMRTITFADPGGYTWAIAQDLPE
jgi:catechol 2,3-dioxygenase-like lactoylglutathione lyase family enzyme